MLHFPWITFIYFLFHLAHANGGCKRKVFKHKNLGNKKRNCTSLKVVNIAYCVGFCLPHHLLNTILPTELNQYIEKYKDRYKCVPDLSKQKNVTVYCADEQRLTKYSYNYVKTCKCKEVKSYHNPLLKPFVKRKYSQKRTKRKHMNGTRSTRWC